MLIRFIKYGKYGAEAMDCTVLEKNKVQGTDENNSPTSDQMQNSDRGLNEHHFKARTSHNRLFYFCFDAGILRNG